MVHEVSCLGRGRILRAWIIMDLCPSGLDPETASAARVFRTRQETCNDRHYRRYFLRACLTITPQEMLSSSNLYNLYRNIVTFDNIAGDAVYHPTYNFYQNIITFHNSTRARKCYHHYTLFRNIVAFHHIAGNAMHHPTYNL